MMHMYVWKTSAFIATVQARSVAHARELVLEHIGEEDGSCSERVKARQHIADFAPSIYYNGNAEFELTDSGLVEEGEECVRRLRKLLDDKGIPPAEILAAERGEFNGRGLK